MILYTPLSSHDVFPYENEGQAHFHVVSLEGTSLYVKQTDKEQLEIIQVLSTDPQDFLNEHIQPGQKISSHKIYNNDASF